MQKPNLPPLSSKLVAFCQVIVIHRARCISRKPNRVLWHVHSLCQWANVGEPQEPKSDPNCWAKLRKFRKRLSCALSCSLSWSELSALAELLPAILLEPTLSWWPQEPINMKSREWLKLKLLHWAISCNIHFFCWCASSPWNVGFLSFPLFTVHHALQFTWFTAPVFTSCPAQSNHDFAVTVIQRENMEDSKTAMFNTFQH